MKIFFLLNHTFFNQSIGIAKEIQSTIPGSEFTGIIAARSDLVDAVQSYKDVNFKNYDWLSTLEKQWLETPLDKDKLEKYKNLLGSRELRRIIIADREIGVGFVSGGIVERTDLIAATLHNDDAKWRYVIGLVDYLYNRYETEKPDIVFAYCVAGAVAFAMGVVAKALNIPFVQPVMARVDYYHILDDNNRWMLNPVKEIFNAAMKNQSIVADSLPEARKFIDNFRNKPISPQDTVTWVKEIRRNNTIAGIVRTVAIDAARTVAINLGLKGTKGVLRQRHGLEIMKNNLRIFWNLRKTLNGKMKEFSSEVGEGDYLYFPLHVDPEASTMVMSDMFTDQMAVIESIAKSMPVGMRLVVKEHIPCVGRRPKGFYKRINNMPDVSLINPFTNNFELIRKARLVCTITGTAGWESMLIGKPPLIIGNVHYLSLNEGFVHCQDLSKIGDAIEKALETAPVSDKALETYIASMIKDSVFISPNDMWFEKYADMDKRKKAVAEMAEKLIIRAEESRASNARAKIKAVS